MPVLAQSYNVLHRFSGPPDGVGPSQSTLLEINGTLFGTTISGGAYGFGSVFKLDGKGRETVLYSFTGGADGALPSSGLIRDAKGNLYGTTENGGDLGCALYGTTGCGVVYKLDTTGTQTVLYTFTDGTDGAWPQGVILDNAGNLYGTTFFGGDLSCGIQYGCGVLYKLDASGNETVPLTFSFGPGGSVPNGFLTMDVAGNIYGAAIDGGDLSACSGSGCGVIFKLDTSGNETVLYTFTGNADGAAPNGSLLQDPQGNLFGTTTAGGDLSCSPNQFTVGCGVVFEITSGKEKVLHTFHGVDGAFPSLGLVGTKKAISTAQPLMAELLIWVRSFRLPPRAQRKYFTALGVPQTEGCPSQV